MHNLPSPSTDSLLLPTRGRSRARPIHLVRQALGIPHFGIAPGAVALPRERKPVTAQRAVASGVGPSAVRGEESDVPWPILSRLPVHVDTPGYGHTLSEDDVGADAPRLLPSTDRSPRVMYTQSRLPGISEQDVPLWQALHHFYPRRQDYAEAFRLISDALVIPHPMDSTTADATACPAFSSRAAAYIPLIRETFNYTRLPPLPQETFGTYYGVLFRSTRARGSSTHRLCAADRRAHEEAVASGGLLVYWYGAPNAAGDNVATCLWTSRGEARRASTLAMHRVASALAKGVYERYELVRYAVVKREGETALTVEQWED